jgi:hypothetical protein
MLVMRPSQSSSATAAARPACAPRWARSETQSRTLGRIIAADLTFVTAPNGYIGRTTCYEIGRLVQARRPLFFSERPKDLPIQVDATFVGTHPQPHRTAHLSLRFLLLG